MMPLRVRVGTPGSSTTYAPAASKNEIPRSRAIAEMRSWVVAPIERAGLFTTRIAETSSLGLRTSLRYAMTSRISARSKNRVPPTIV